MRHAWPIALSPMLLLVACAVQRPVHVQAVEPQAAVSYRAVADKDAPQYKVASTQAVVTPTTGPHNGAPEYPAQLLRLKLPPRQVQALVIVDAQGRVSRVSVAGEETADSITRAFDAAVRQAVQRWTFEPLRITTWQDMPDGSSKRVANKPMPFSQNYVFSFRMVDGKPVVSAGAPSAKWTR